MNPSRNHEECGDTRGRLYERDTPKGILWYCHNCGKGGLRFKDGLTPREVVKLCSPIEQNDPLEVTLPRDVTYLLPIEALAWLWKYDLDQYEIDTMRCCYSPSMNRLILPVYKNDAAGTAKLVYWQGRNLGVIDKKNPKYINSKKKKGEDCFFKTDVYSSDKSRLCLVEDIISAVKVGRACDSIALLGSYIPMEIVRLLTEQRCIVPYDQILIWLDYDKQKESIQFSKRLRELTGKDIRCIITEKDPKEYSTEEIEKYVYSL
jgi:hypothetical protein